MFSAIGKQLTINILFASQPENVFSCSQCVSLLKPICYPGDVHLQNFFSLSFTYQMRNNHYHALYVCNTLMDAYTRGNIVENEM